MSGDVPLRSWCGIAAPARCLELDWCALLRRFMTGAARRDYTWSQPNRRFIDSGLYLSAMHAQRTALLADQCAKANGLEPYAYLRHVFTALPKAKSLAEVEALLPTRLHPAALAPDALQESFRAARQ